MLGLFQKILRGKKDTPPTPSNTPVMAPLKSTLPQLEKPQLEGTRGVWAPEFFQKNNLAK